MTNNTLRCIKFHKIQFKKKKKKRQIKWLMKNL